MYIFPHAILNRIILIFHNTVLMTIILATTQIYHEVLNQFLFVEHFNFSLKLIEEINCAMTDILIAYLHTYLWLSLQLIPRRHFKVMQNCKNTDEFATYSFAFLDTFLTWSGSLFISSYCLFAAAPPILKMFIKTVFLLHSIAKTASWASWWLRW